MIDLAYRAMMFARKVHRDQKRKYTGAPYSDHLAEVAGIVSTVASYKTGDNIADYALSQVMVAVAWLHDCIEDQKVEYKLLYREFGPWVANAVLDLSDLEEGNRKTRKKLSRERLSLRQGWVQTIKCADLISNTSSILQYDEEFAIVYLKEKRMLLDVLTKADRRLWDIADKLCNEGLIKLGVS